MRRVVPRRTPPVTDHTGGDAKTQARRRPSYHPTGIKLADRVLDVIDELTNARADWFQRLYSYLFIGGMAALVNLITLYIVLNARPIPRVSHDAQYAVAFVVATEVSILTSFILNDRITFGRLPGHGRRWIARCLRFHTTATGGVIVTAFVSVSLHLQLQMAAISAQAIALITAVAFNFTFHHVFTYRHRASEQ
jgi:putative flippase GtrA